MTSKRSPMSAALGAKSYTEVSRGGRIDRPPRHIDDHAVDIPRPLRAHLGLDHVAEDRLRVAVERRAVAAAAGRAVADDVAGLEPDGRLGRQVAGLAVGVQDVA